MKIFVGLITMKLYFFGFGGVSLALSRLIHLYNFDDMDQGKAHFVSEEKMLEMQDKILNGLQKKIFCAWVKILENVN